MQQQQLSQVEVYMGEDFFPGMGGSFYTCEILEEGPDTCLCRIVGDPDKTLFNAPRNRFYPIRGSKKQDTWLVGSHVEVGYRIGSPLEPLGYWPAVVTEQKGPRIVLIRWVGPYDDGVNHQFHSHCLRDSTFYASSESHAPPHFPLDESA